MNSTNLPQIASKSSYKMVLEPGTYYWCSCGLSKSQPLCDGSHSKTDFTPKEFVIREKKRYSLCGCKITNKQPFCDNAHRELR